MGYIADGLPLLFPTGDHRGALARAIRDLAVPAAVGRPLLTALDLTAPLLSSNPSQTLLDERIDLAEWGVLASSQLCYLDAWTEKLVDGVWVALNLTTPDQVPPNFPALDVQGYFVEFGFIADDLDTPVAALPILSGTTEFGNWAGTDPQLVNGATFTPPEGQRTRLRAVARANCSSGQYDSLNYRFRMRVRVPDLTVWSKEVAIPAANPVVNGVEVPFLDEPLLSLADFGVSSDATDVAVVALFRRNGKTIRIFDSHQSLVGETFDPPTYPVQVYVHVATLTLPVYGKQNGGAGSFNSCPLYGGGDQSATPYPSGVKGGGSWLGGSLGACTEWINDTVKISAWRDGPAPTTYTPANGAAPIDVPAGDVDGCTLLIKIFRAPHFLRRAYPFNLSTPYLAPDGGPRDLGAYVGDGTPQVIAHGYAGAPTSVRVVPMIWPPGSGVDSTEAHDATNVTITMTAGVTYAVLVWPPSGA